MQTAMSNSIPILSETLHHSIFSSGLNLLYIEKIRSSKPFIVLKIIIKAAVQTAKASIAILEIILMAFRFFLANKYLSDILKEVCIVKLKNIQIKFSF